MKCSILALGGRDHTGSSEGQWFTIDITVQAGDFAQKWQK